MPPRHWLDGGTTWDHRSRILAIALQTLEDETGPNGFPLDLELDPDMNGWFEADVVMSRANVCAPIGWAGRMTLAIERDATGERTIVNTETDRTVR